MEYKRGFTGMVVLFLLAILFISPSISAEIIVDSQPATIYNLGDIITVPITVKSTTNLVGNFQMNLICNGNQLDFYKNGISLLSGEEKKIESSLILSKNVIENLKGTCRVKAFIGTQYTLTNDFEISELIILRSNFSKTDFNPSENILVKGEAVKKNGNSVNGFIELSILSGDSTILAQQGTVNSGFFSINITLPKDIKAGNYLLRLRAHEEDLSEAITNTGYLDQGVYVNQVPTSLEVIFENVSVEPGTNVKVKAMLYDQTGTKIDSLAFLTIKNKNDKIRDQVELSTDEFKEFPIAYNEAPAAWKVVAVSNKLTSEAIFEILEKENVSIEFINKTVLITNTGNVPYNKTVLIKIGNQTKDIDVYLKVDQSQRWVLTAPEGEYAVQVVNDGKITGASIALTGETVDVKKVSANLVSLIKFPIVWIFVLAILGFVAFIFFKRGYQKSFIGYISAGPRIKSEDKPMELFIHNPKSARAELELSIKGDKQEVSMITLKIKNIVALKNSKESGAHEILEKIKQIAEDQKAATYENDDSIFFIFAPVRTKTFRNELTALRIAQRIKEALTEQNRLFKQKIDFGISLNSGEIIAKQEPECFKFMGMGTLMMQSKRTAAAAENDILMTEKITEKLRTAVKTERIRKDNMDLYLIKEIKNPEEHQKFLKGFMRRMEKDK